MHGYRFGYGPGTHTVADRGTVVLCVGGSLRLPVRTRRGLNLLIAGRTAAEGPRNAEAAVRVRFGPVSPGPVLVLDGPAQRWKARRHGRRAGGSGHPGVPGGRPPPDVGRAPAPTLRDELGEVRIDGWSLAWQGRAVPGPGIGPDPGTPDGLCGTTPGTGDGRPSRRTIRGVNSTISSRLTASVVRSRNKGPQSGAGSGQARPPQ